MKTKEPPQLSLQAKVILALWKSLGVWAAVIAFTLSYAGFVWLTKERLTDAHLRSRMFIFAKLVDATKEPGTAKQFLTLLTNVVQEASGTNVQRCSSPAVTYRLPDLTNQVAIAAALTTMSSNKPPSYDFTVAVKELRFLLNEIREEGQSFREKPGWRRLVQKFSVNDLRLAGVDFREPQANMATLQQDAGEFLVHRDFFHGSAKQAPNEIKLRPWTILRFYDVRRVNLNETIPLAFATLLLACGFFLEMRFSDYSPKWSWRRDDSLRYRETFNDRSTVSQKGKCVPLWEESQTSGPHVVSLFRQKAFWRLLIGLNGLALFIEFFLQNPQQRQEWIINAPIMVCCATGLTVLFMTLHDLGRLRINPELARFSPEFRKRLFRPLLMGTGSLFAVCVWGVFYSIVELAGLSGMHLLRAAIQVALCGYALWLLARLLIGIEGQLGTLRPMEAQEVSEATEKQLSHPGNFSLLGSVFPDLDERLIRAAALGLIPLSSIIQSLL